MHLDLLQARLPLLPDFAAALFPLYRAYFWLRYGFGLSYSCLDFLIENDKNDISGVRRAVLETKWLGVQKTFIWLLSQPFELSCVALAVVCGIVAKVLFDENRKLAT